MAVQAGFVAGTLASAVLNLADVVHARRLFAAGCAAGALANAAIPFAPDAASVIALRCLTGAALACVYPPGLKIAAGWFLDRRGFALGVVVGALTVGSALPHLLAWVAADVPWKLLMWTSSALALTGGALVAIWVKDGPHVMAVGSLRRARGASRSAEPRRADRDARIPRPHVGALCDVDVDTRICRGVFNRRGGSAAGRRGSLVAFVAIASGAVGCVLAGQWADAFGKARVAGGAMLTSAACAALAGFVFGAPLPWLLLLAVAWGFSVVADSAQFSALVAESSAAQPRRHRPDAADLRRVSADDGEHAAAAGRRRGDRMAVGVRGAGARAAPGRPGHAALQRFLNSPHSGIFEP